jgi:hypothetical protein
MIRFPMGTGAFALLCAAALSACTTLPAADAGLPDGTKRFSGAVQAVDDGCFADGTCSVTVNDVLVVTLTGWSRDTWGQRDTELQVGERVDVACRPTLEGCTLNGNAGYYVRRAR